MSIQITNSAKYFTSVTYFVQKTSATYLRLRFPTYVYSFLQMPKIKTIYLSKPDIDVEFKIGINAKDNFDIIDLAEKHHLWLHNEKNSSCHVIANIPDTKFDHKIIKAIVTQGAILCKQHSKYASDKDVSIMYTQIEHVTKDDRTIGSVHVSKYKTITI